MPAVVSDTSVLHYLAAIGCFDPLRVQFGALLIPPAVHTEIQSAGTLPVVREVQSALRDGWIEVAAPRPGQTLNLLLNFLDAGEAEAIALAAERAPARLLLDEAEGREAARRLGIPVVGTVGILAAARRDGRMPRLKPVLDDLIQHHRFRLAAVLYEQLIADDPPANQGE